MALIEPVSPAASAALGVTGSNLTKMQIARINAGVQKSGIEAQIQISELQAKTQKELQSQKSQQFRDYQDFQENQQEGDQVFRAQQQELAQTAQQENMKQIQGFEMEMSERTQQGRREEMEASFRATESLRLRDVENALVQYDQSYERRSNVRDIARQVGVKDTIMQGLAEKNPLKLKLMYSEIEKMERGYSAANDAGMLAVSASVGNMLNDRFKAGTSDVKKDWSKLGSVGRWVGRAATWPISKPLDYFSDGRLDPLSTSRRATPEEMVGIMWGDSLEGLKRTGTVSWTPEQWQAVESWSEAAQTHVTKGGDGAKGALDSALTKLMDQLGPDGVDVLFHITDQLDVRATADVGAWAQTVIGLGGDQKGLSKEDRRDWEQSFGWSANGMRATLLDAGFVVPRESLEDLGRSLEDFTTGIAFGSQELFDRSIAELRASGNDKLADRLIKANNRLDLMGSVVALEVATEKKTALVRRGKAEEDAAKHADVQHSLELIQGEDPIELFK